jgi:hypothetical protein
MKEASMGHTSGKKGKFAERYFFKKHEGNKLLRVSKRSRIRNGLTVWKEFI